MKSLTAVLFLVWSVSAEELPAGTPIQVRLKAKVASNASQPHDSVEAVVIKPVLSGDRYIIPYGAVLRGEVETADASAGADKRALLTLNFNQLVLAHGKSAKIAARVTEVDNARESVDEKGSILGILASETLSARMDQGLAKLGQRASGLADFLQLAKDTFLKAPESEIVYEPGVEMTIQLTSKLLVDAGAVPGVSISLQPIASEAKLTELVNAQPFQTMAANPQKPSDLTNLMFIGSQQELEAAFTAAGWAPAAALSKSSAWETFRSIAELRGYKEAPMSMLLLDRRPADLNYQKQNNTFAQRHHLRIWKRPIQWQGQDVWVASSTHDVGIDFSQENGTFIHRVDPHIDEERAKVVTDLMFTAAVKSLAVVGRPGVPTEAMNATGDKLLTDGRMAVLLLTRR